MPKTNTKNKAEVEAPATEETRSKRTRWREQATIRLTEKGSTNPKKPKSMSAERYDVLLKLCNAANGEPVSVAELFRAGYRMDDVRHDAAHGFIELNQPFEL